MDDVIVFGHGQYFIENREDICRRYHIIEIIDNSVFDASFDDAVQVKIHNPSILVNEYNDEKILITSPNHYRDMFGQLLGYNIPEKNIIFYVGEHIASNNNKICYVTPDGEPINFENQEELKILKRKYELERNINNIAVRKIINKPSSVDPGQYGQPIDRYYIEKFLYENKSLIHGTVLEVQDDRYTRMFPDYVAKSIICHVKGWNNTKLINFETGEGVENGLADCIICTQTLQYIFDVKEAVRNIYRMLRPEGTALITVPGIKPLSLYHEEKWGEYWSFTVDSIRKLCEDVFESYSIQAYGNLKSSIAFLNGSCKEELSTEELETNDIRYPMLICARLRNV